MRCCNHRSDYDDYYGDGDGDDYDDNFEIIKIMASLETIISKNYRHLCLETNFLTKLAQIVCLIDTFTFCDYKF